MHSINEFLTFFLCSAFMLQCSEKIRQFIVVSSILTSHSSLSQGWKRISRDEQISYFFTDFSLPRFFEFLWSWNIFVFSYSFSNNNLSSPARFKVKRETFAASSSVLLCTKYNNSLLFLKTHKSEAIETLPKKGTRVSRFANELISRV